MPINFYNQLETFNLKGKRVHKQWMSLVAEKHNKTIGEISVIFCSDEQLLEINRKYLNHDYLTDIITFDYCTDTTLSGDLFISVDTVKSNSKEYKVAPKEELSRVIIHGLLHLIGFKDKSNEDATTMRSKENESLELLQTITDSNKK